MSTAEEMEKGFELEVYEPGEALARAEAMFPQERREQIAQFLEVPADHPAFLPFLAIAAAYHLNPTMGEIWLIPENIREKVGGQWQTVGKRYKPSVGRDGLLSIARRDPSFVGIKHDVVCVNDTFEVEHDTERFDAPPKITHKYAKKEAGKSPKASRGAVIGAWAVLYLRNRPPVYYFADAAEHAQTTTKDGRKVYSGAWDHTSQMLIKAAMSYVLRLGIGVTGLLPADEMLAPSLDEVRKGAELTAGDEEPAGTLPPEEEFWDGIRETAGDEVVIALKAKFEGVALAEVEMTLAGLDEDALREKAGITVAEEEPVEAEVVDEDGDGPADVDPAEVEPGVDVLALRKRREALREELDTEGVDDERLAELQAEIEQVDEELARIAGENPEQGHLL